MAHLDKLPTYFVKGDDRKAAYYTVDARELLEAGYVEEGAEVDARPSVTGPLPEKPVVAGGDGFDFEPEVLDVSLDELTKAELLDWALDLGHDLKNNLSKAEILKQCKEIEEQL